MRQSSTTELIRTIGTDGITLLKNTGGLPVQSPQRIAVLGKYTCYELYIIKLSTNDTDITSPQAQMLEIIHWVQMVAALVSMTAASPITYVADIWTS